MFCEEPILEFEIIEANLGLKCAPYPLDTIGTVFPVIDISDRWGVLSVTDKGCLIMKGKARVTAENIVVKESIATGTGWELKLNAGWIISKEADDYMIKRK